MRSSDWSSWVCSSDLSVGPAEAVRIDFVVDLTGTPGNNDYAPLANQTHAFDSHYSANGASAFFSNLNSSSSVRIVARDDLDADNDVGDGVKDSITGVALSFHGPTLTVTATGLYNVGKSDEHTSDLQSLIRISYTVF